MTITRSDAEALAGTFFAQSTREQQAAYDTAIQSALGLPTDAWCAARDLARRQWDHDTREARILFGKTVEAILKNDGEVPEEVSYLWDLLDVGAAMQAAE